MTISSTANSLDAFAAMADLQGHSRESVALLMNASRKIKAGEQDAGLAAELIAWSMVASSSGQAGFADVLYTAASELTELSPAA